MACSDLVIAIANDASGEREIFSRKKAAPKRDLFVGQQW
jgi:hypothetical protein